MRALKVSKYLKPFCRTVNDFLYIAGQLNVENLAGNQFVNFAVVSLTEVPTVVIGEFFMNRMGRRWSQVLGQVLTAIIYAIIVALTHSGIKGTYLQKLPLFSGLSTI